MIDSTPEITSGGMSVSVQSFGLAGGNANSSRANKPLSRSSPHIAVTISKRDRQIVHQLDLLKQLDN